MNFTVLLLLLQTWFAVLRLTICVAESPLQFYVNHASSPNVTAYGPGLSYGVANKLATFTVFTEDASEGTDYTFYFSLFNSLF